MSELNSWGSREIQTNSEQAQKSWSCSDEQHQLLGISLPGWLSMHQDNSVQYWHNELTVLDVSSVTELHDAQPPATTGPSTQLRIKIAARLKIVTQLEFADNQTTTTKILSITETNEPINDTATVILDTHIKKTNFWLTGTKRCQRERRVLVG